MTQILQISVRVLKDEFEMSFKREASLYNLKLFRAGSFKTPPYIKDGKRPLK